MESNKNPFRKSSKSYLIAEKLLKKVSYDDIEKELGVKRSLIFNVKSRLWKKGLLHPEEGQKDAEKAEKDAGPKYVERGEKGKGEEQVDPASPILSPDMEAFKEDLLRSVGDIMKQGLIDDKAPESTIVVNEGSLVKRSLLLTPKTLVLFDMAVAAGYPGNLSSFLNQMVTEVYTKRNARLSLTEITPVA